MHHLVIKIKNNFVVGVADKLLTPLISAFLFLLIIMLPIDAYEFLKEPKDYILVHHLDTTKTDWKFQYLKSNGLLFFGTLAALTVIIYGVKEKGNKYAFLLKMVVVIGVAVAIIYGFYQWYLTGFDH